MRHGPAGLLVPVAILSLACSSHLPPKPDVFTQSRDEIRISDRTVHLDLVKPVTAAHPGVLILFATGDAGWIGASKDLFRHMADEGYAVAAYDSREALRRYSGSGAELTFAEAATLIGSVLAEARTRLGLPADAPAIVTGDSRGAGMVVFDAGEPTLQKGILGAVAVALTREGDYLKAPDPADRPPSIQVDERGRIQTYPALERLGGIKIAVIQSTGDRYVPAAEARTLFGPDTPTRRLYAVQARNHGFDGGREEMLRDLDDALAWICGGSGR